jgi:hypothetical protein
VEDQLKKIQDELNGFNEKLDKKLDEKLDEKLSTTSKKMLTEKLMGMKTQGIPEENHWTAQHIEPHQEETSNSRTI